MNKNKATWKVKESPEYDNGGSRQEYKTGLIGSVGYLEYYLPT
jgi:hypothetical protein